MNILIGYILTYSYIFLILLVTNILLTKFNVSQEITRKLVHIFVGFSWFIMAKYFKTSIHLLIPPLTFIFINYISLKKNLIKPISKQDNFGTVYYAISFTLLAFFSICNPKFLPYYGLGVITMCLADGLAPLISKSCVHKIGKSYKTYGSQFVVLIITFLIAVFFNWHYNLEFNLISYLIISLSSSILEFIGTKGLDNITLPIGIALIASLL